MSHLVVIRDEAWVGDTVERFVPLLTLCTPYVTSHLSRSVRRSASETLSAWGEKGVLRLFPRDARRLCLASLLTLAGDAMPDVAARAREGLVQGMRGATQHVVPVHLDPVPGHPRDPNPNPNPNPNPPHPPLDGDDPLDALVAEAEQRVGWDGRDIFLTERLSRLDLGLLDMGDRQQDLNLDLDLDLDLASGSGSGAAGLTSLLARESDSFRQAFGAIFGGGDDDDDDDDDEEEEEEEEEKEEKEEEVHPRDGATTMKQEGEVDAMEGRAERRGEDTEMEEEEEEEQERLYPSDEVGLILTDTREASSYPNRRLG